MTELACDPDPAAGVTTDHRPVRLRLFIAGATMRSAQTIAALTRLCDTRLPGRYQLEIIDVYRQPERAQSDNVVAIPTLLLLRPRLERYFIGDFVAGGRLATMLDYLGAGGPGEVRT